MSTEADILGRDDADDLEAARDFLLAVLPDLKSVRNREQQQWTVASRLHG